MLLNEVGIEEVIFKSFDEDINLILMNKPYNFNKEMLELSYASGKTMTEIGHELGCPAATILGYFKKYNIKSRAVRANNTLLLKKPQTKFIERTNPFWIVGFIDGEGSYFFDYLKSKQSLGPGLAIGQKNKESLELIKSCFPEIHWSLSGDDKNCYILRAHGFKDCFSILWFFDKFKPIQKQDQYSIWKYLIYKLLQTNFSREDKAKISLLYKSIKIFDVFKKKFEDEFK